MISVVSCLLDEEFIMDLCLMLRLTSHGTGTLNSRRYHGSVCMGPADTLNCYQDPFNTEIEQKCPDNDKRQRENARENKLNNGDLSGRYFFHFILNRNIRLTCEGPCGPNQVKAIVRCQLFHYSIL